MTPSPPDPPFLLGKAIEERRLQLNMTPTEFGRRMDRDYRWTYRIETGEYRLRIEDLSRACRVLNITADRLLDRAEALGREALPA